MRASATIEAWDARLASLACMETALRLRLGQLLEVVGRGAVFELGFPSLGAYAVERCERSVRWAEGARCLARRLEALPELRRRMAMGKVSWSMGELLARVATPEDESRWLEVAESRTVRQVRSLVALERDARRGAAIVDPGDDDLGSLESGSEETCRLTCTIDREDAWLFEATRCLLEQLGVQGTALQVEALLAEAQGTLLASLPASEVDSRCSPPSCPAHERWEQELHRWRDRAEASCENDLLDHLRSTRAPRTGPAERLGVALEASLGIAPLEHASCMALDRKVRATQSALARHELEVSQLVLRFLRARGWRSLGYATEAQYARERLGWCRSSLLARRTLALRLEDLPRVAAALGASEIGVEAALQLVRIATPKTEAEWIERARRRTIKHLREEVAAALTAVRVSGERDCPPPEKAELEAFQTLEQKVVSGQFGQPQAASEATVGGAGERAPTSGAGRKPAEPASEARRAWCVMLASLAAWLEGGVQMSAVGVGASADRACASAGRVALRLSMSRESASWWRELETKARPYLPRGVSWLRFVCLSFWRAGHHLLRGEPVAYERIYIRDRFRCTSPVCNRRDVTPHHLQLRSAGGSDDDDNVASVCVWCHLYGVHGGRIRATGTADHIRWELGPRRSPVLVVNGRERVAA